MNQFVKTIEYNKLGYEFLQSLNGLLCLTDRELELLSIFLRIHLTDARIRKGKASVDTSTIRKSIMEETRITKDNLSRYIKTFRAKRIFIKNEHDRFTYLNKALIPVVIGNKTVQITMILKLNNDVAI